MKYILLVFTLLLSINSHAWTQRPNAQPQACAAHVPYGMPQVQKADATLICRQGYFLLHDNQAKHAAWAAWVIMPQLVNGCWPRTNAFTVDQALGPKSARPDDYAGTGYDKGHVANDAHQSWDEQVEYESFLMTNMMPQLPGLNRGIWKLLETATGAWTFDRQAPHLIYAGPVYNVTTDKKIGAGQVNVPYGFYKIVVNTATGNTLAFLFPHAENQGNDLTVVQTTVAEVERVTGVSFPVPGNRAVKEPLWPINFANVAANKKQVCKR